MAWRLLMIFALIVGATDANPNDYKTCQACRSVVSYATKFNSSTHRQEYSDLFKGFCEQYYPPSTDFQNGPCSVLVQGIFYVLDHTDPVTHCDNLGACGPEQPSDDIYRYLQDSNVSEKNVPQPQNQAVCDYCINLFDQVKSIFTDPARVKFFKDKLNELCDYLKVINEDKQCKDVLVTRYFDFVEWVSKNINGKKYCTEIKLCNAARASPKRLPTLADFNNFGIETAVTIGAKVSNIDSTQPLGSPQCTLCKTVVKEMFHFLRENKTEENIIEGLDRVCQLIYPSEPHLGECKSMVKAYTRELLQLLMDETDPEVICTLLEQCLFNKISEPHPIDQVESAPVPSPADQNGSDLAHLITALDSSIGLKSVRSCVECKIFIRYLKDKLSNPQSIAELKQWLLDNLCKELPERSLVDSCSEMIENYAEVFFKAVVGELNPQTACVELGVCKARSFVHVLNIGGQSSTQPKLSGSQPEAMSKEKRCNRCTDVVSQLDDYLAAHQINDETTWDEVCKYTQDPSARSECMSTLSQYGADIVQKIPTMESPRHLCKQIALC